MGANTKPFWSPTHARVGFTTVGTQKGKNRQRRYAAAGDHHIASWRRSHFVNRYNLTAPAPERVYGAYRREATMQSLRFFGVTGGILLVLAAKAWGVSQCVVGCTAQYRMCVETGVVALHASGLECREILDPHAKYDCITGSGDAYRAASLSCRTDAKSCKASCAPAPDVDETCLENCAGQLGSCAGGVLQAALSCVRGCRTAPDYLTCTQGCLAALQADGAPCGDDFTTCLGGCVPPTP